MKRHYRLLGMLLTLTGCTTVTTTEIRYDRDLVQYITLPAVETSVVREVDPEGLDEATSEAGDGELRELPASAPSDLGEHEGP